MLRCFAFVGLAGLIGGISWLIARDVQELRAPKKTSRTPSPAAEPGAAPSAPNPPSASTPRRSFRDGQWREEAQEYGWVLDYQAGKDAARLANQPLMVVLRCIP